MRRLLTPVAGHDEDLLGFLIDWSNYIRRDLRGIPLVVPVGGLVVVETPSRKNAGAHYTPRSLAEEVVLLRARAARLRAWPAADQRRERLATEVQHRDPRPQGRRHRRRLRRVPRGRGALPGRPCHRGMEDRGSTRRTADRRAATGEGPGHPRGHRPLPLRRGHQPAWPSRCASSRSGSCRWTRPSPSPSSTTRSSAATPCSASPRSTSCATCTSTPKRPTDRAQLLVDIDAKIAEATRLRNGARLAGRGARPDALHPRQGRPARAASQGHR